jgi:hypothetical protein
MIRQGDAVYEYSSVTINRACAEPGPGDSGGDAGAGVNAGYMIPVSRLPPERNGDEWHGDFAATAEEWLSRYSLCLFDYFTVLQNPHDDALPNIGAQVYGSHEASRFTPNPAPVSNADPTRANGGAEDGVPTDGLINVNTAP